MTILDEARKRMHARVAATPPPSKEELDAAIAAATGEVSYKALGAAMKMGHTQVYTWVGNVLKRAVACGLLVRKEQ